jgi:hypothetical protein
MRFMKIAGLAAAILLVIACFLPWIYIESRSITVTGIDATGTNFGKPGYFHFAMAFWFVVFTLTSRVWAKRANLLVTALNLAWALRNFFIIPACEGGECPIKKAGLYLVLVSSLLIMASGLLPDMKEKAR